MLIGERITQKKGSLRVGFEQVESDELRNGQDIFELFGKVLPFHKLVMNIIYKYFRLDVRN